ncbi:apolipoprotein N-acyltransferase [Burkholderiaceae bacterium FT117]|uniref:apolipoprotein N-acyltransferase n=1 Tax=Zeimonas sediminis TaxID=2944268 RepID=UPI002342C5FD|nr:apolipoprotein N-acyltransferase [Zeimonas sediminis]MCM5570287.1 apolipoprotein N-acyltransferase [Zeimonas sediminis]
MLRDRLRRAAAPGAAFAAGLVHAASFAPLGLWWLQLLALAAAIRIACAARSPTLAGLAFGFGWFVSGVAWLFVSMHRYGGMPAPMAAAALVLFALYLGAFAATGIALATPSLRRALPGGAGRTPRGVAGAALLFAGLWGAGEMLRGWLFTGFPWLSSGYAQVDGPLAGLAPAVGVHGVGAAAALVAAALALAAPPSRREGESAGPGASAGRRAASGALAAALACLALPLLAGLALLPVRWADEVGEPIRVRLLQGNVPQQMKFDPARSVAAMQAYAQAIAAEPADLIVLPETAWTVPWSRTPPSIAAAIVDAVGDGVVAIGMPLPARTRRGEPTLSNSVAAIGAGGPLPWRYDKRHLVPFGEFVPPGFRWFVDMMEIPLGDFGRGAPHQPALDVRGQRLAFNICYEDIFGRELAPQVRDGATILVNVSNIAWFGESHALPQHLQIARMRAIEFARPMLRATNTGVTAAIDARGRVLGALRPHSEESLAASLRGTSGLTPYARAGDLAPLALVAALALAGLAFGAAAPRE